MKAIAPFLLVTALFAADDPGGWTAAKWGMVPDQVRATVPELKPDHTEFDRGVFATFRLDDLHLGAPAPVWSVYFIFTDGRLARVELCPTLRPFATADEFVRVESLVTEKYGRPFDRSAAPIRMATWTAGQTTITLRHADYRPRAQLQTLWLTYQPKQSAPL